MTNNTTADATPLRKGERTTQRALDAAERLFADKGYDGTTMRQIADEIGIREPSLYKHFQSKEAVYDAVLERGVKPLLTEIEGWTDQPTSLHELLTVPQRLLTLLAQHPNVAKLLHREMIASEMSPAARQWFHRLFSSSQQIMAVLNPHNDPRLAKQARLQSIAMTNIVLGFFASGPLYQQLGGEDLLEEDSIAQQSKVVSQIFKAFLIGG